MIQLRSNIEGWTDYLTWFRNVALSSPPDFSYVEVGAHKGQSILALADCLAEYGKNGTLTALAPSPASLEPDGKELEIEAHSRKSPIPIRVIAGDALETTSGWPDESADLVFLDAPTQYGDLWEQLTAWWPRVKPGGMLAGHDFQDSGWVDVAPTVRRWAREEGLQITYEPPRNWWVRKPGREAWFRKSLWDVDVRMPHHHAMNPAVARDPLTGRLVMTFRTTSWGWGIGRLWAATLDDKTMELEAVPDLLLLGDQGLNYEDPRLFIHQDRLWLAATITNFSGETSNRMGVARLGADGIGWKVEGSVRIFDSPFGQRQEKNWVFFEKGQQLLRIYSMIPWRVQTCDSPPHTLVEHPGLNWSYGEPRGGSQFFEAPNGNWWAFFHSSWSGGYCTGLVEMDPGTLLPLRMTRKPLFQDEPMSPGWMGYAVIWVAGAVVMGDKVLISYGINDHSSHLRLVPLAALEELLYPLS